MTETFSSFSYKSIDTVTSMLCKDDFMAVTNIASAYRSVLIRPCDRTVQGVSWEIDGKQEWLEDHFLSFGTWAALFIFSRITDSIVRHLETRGIRAVNYLDDFLVMGSTWQECKEAQLYLHSVLQSLGFYISYPKLVSPSQLVIYLGILIDSVTMKLSPPEEKMVKLHHELHFFEGKSKATEKQLQCLCGILGHCATLVKGGRTFSRQVTARSM